jgi:hypothetical protein
MEWLSLTEAARWAQIGFCFALGFGLAYGIGRLLGLLFEIVSSL